MKILHYLSGLPPVRTGGMIRYALDLMIKQSMIDEVCLLIPGRLSSQSAKRDRISIEADGKLERITLYHVINPLPVPMANGIKDIDWFTMPGDKRVYREFLEKLRPDVIHVHTFMGMHSAFLSAAKELGIPRVFTTHDYFGICPKTDLVDHGRICERPGKHCVDCCKYAFPEKRMVLEQSALYRLYRQQAFLTRLAQARSLKKSLNSIRSYNPEQAAALQNEQQLVSLADNNNLRTDDQAESRTTGDSDYARLLNYYRTCFGMIDAFHFNSSLSRKVYESFLGPLNGQIILNSNASVSDRRRERTVNFDCIRIGYLGGDSPYKGLHLLRQSVSKLWDEGIRNIRLIVYGNSERSPYEFCEYRDAYRPDELERVFSDMDILAVPSTWQETFGLVALEALSFGVPVIMTENVGAKDLLLNAKSVNDIGYVTTPSADSIEGVLRDISQKPGLITEMNRNILNMNFDFDFSSHVNAIHKLYEEILG